MKIIDHDPASGRETVLLASDNAWIETTSVDQLKVLGQRDGAVRAVGFPDLHPGKGSPVGAALLSWETIHPFVVGGDIGCGMTFWQTDVRTRKAKTERWANTVDGLESPWGGDVREWLASSELEPGEFDASMGTIGGGNHFAELQAVESVVDDEVFRSAGLESDRLFLLVHSGSRGLGDSILRSHVDRHRDAGVTVDSAAGADYLSRHDSAVRWAAANRRLIARRFAEQIRADVAEVWNGCHNALSRVESDGGLGWLHRKGAAPVGSSLAVVPGSRGTLSYLVAPESSGFGNLWSMAHGAGRKWNRTHCRDRVKAHFRKDELTRTSLGSHVVCEDKALLYEEAPMVYKRIEKVIEDLVADGIVRVVAMLKPVLTYKARSLRK